MLQSYIKCIRQRILLNFWSVFTYLSSLSFIKYYKCTFIDSYSAIILLVPTTDFKNQVIYKNVYLQFEVFLNLNIIHLHQIKKCYGFVIVIKN